MEDTPSNNAVSLTNRASHGGPGSRVTAVVDMSLEPESDRPTRESLLAKMRAHLGQISSPRIEMTLIVAATASVGFLASRTLLALGLENIAARYACAVGIAYVAFLLCLWVWLLATADRLELEPDPDVVVDAIDGLSQLPTPDHLTGGAGDSGPDFALGDLAGDELAVVVALLAAICVGAVSAVYVVYSAPALLAEVLLDGTLSYGLYRRLRGVERRHWVESAVRRTWLPALAVVASFTLAGVAMQWYAPEAASIGQVWRQMTAPH